MNDGSCFGTIETGTKSIEVIDEIPKAEEIPEVIVKKIPKPAERERTVILTIESKSVSLFWDFICRTFSNDYKGCIDKFG
jgi:hypothetical protein